jgi:HEAT repeat protein
VWAIQALYNTVGKEAIPVLMKVLGKDAAVVFHDPNKQWTKDAMWLHAAATAATALASMGNSVESAKAADLISAALENRMTSIPLRQIWRGEEIEWALIRALGRLGGQRHAPVLYDYLRPGDDTDAMAEALTALAQMGAHEALPRIVLSLRSFQYLPVGLHAVAALGKLGTSKEAAYLTPLLLHWDEEMRAEAAKALAMIGGIDVVTALRSAADNEQIQWVRDVIETAAREVARGK